MGKVEESDEFGRTVQVVDVQCRLASGVRSLIPTSNVRQSRGGWRWGRRARNTLDFARVPWVFPCPMGGWHMCIALQTLDRLIMIVCLLCHFPTCLGRVDCLAGNCNGAPTEAAHAAKTRMFNGNCPDARRKRANVEPVPLEAVHVEQVSDAVGVII